GRGRLEALAQEGRDRQSADAGRQLERGRRRYAHDRRRHGRAAQPAAAHAAQFRGRGDGPDLRSRRADPPPPPHRADSGGVPVVIRAGHATVIGWTLLALAGCATEPGPTPGVVAAPTSGPFA